MTSEKLEGERSPPLWPSHTTRVFFLIKNDTARNRHDGILFADSNRERKQSLLPPCISKQIQCSQTCPRQTKDLFIFSLRCDPKSFSQPREPSWCLKSSSGEARAGGRLKFLFTCTVPSTTRLQDPNPVRMRLCVQTATCAQALGAWNSSSKWQQCLEMWSSLESRYQAKRNNSYP